MSTNNFAEIVKGMRNCANGKPCVLCRLNQIFRMFSRRGKIFVTEVHSTNASIGFGGKW
ncbi:hypothetical protein L210DRAFT_3514090 [Boletus edulis BED1]|uniref:Uncharacterized protein n=1 Tax=Boletus edulis BED1 TaxID=1328754 RepID=A0AAD4BCD3_BOLED|nr:hypothetical protein L210DRAFT_3577882 [Boletus edulis BED1]KAF8451901.1 hypothetical protein L210DRAFT_3514090 [Boletus edulis BED1]